MAVKILHAADLHLDSPFESLTREKALLRRREQRENLLRLADAANGAEADIVLLAGDLFDSGASCRETGEALVSALERIRGRVFIAPGNHDFYSARSPYSHLKFPENTHIFRTPEITGIEIPELSCRVWGAAMTAPETAGILRGFSVPQPDCTEIMVLHGDTLGGAYNPVSEADIAETGLDYLALGHIHAFSGIKTAGKTAYAYPGCPEGRGFDETGEKGVIVGTVEKGKTDLSFLPLCRRRYRVITADMSGAESASAAVGAALAEADAAEDVCRVVLQGEFGGRIDTDALEREFETSAFHLTVRDGTRLPRSFRDAAAEDSLTGIFVRKMLLKCDEAPENERRKYELAIRYGLAALENREEWSP